MRRSIHTQILLPFAATVFLAVSGIAVSSSWLAILQAEDRILAQLNGVTKTLSRLTVPFTESVLQQVRGLSGAEFVALAGSNRISASTLPEDLPPAKQPQLMSLPPSLPQSQQPLSELPVIELQRTRFLVKRITVHGPDDVDTVIVLYPEAEWRAARQSALWPPLIFGAVTLVVVIGISNLLARSIGHRIQTVRQSLAAIAAGESPASDPPAIPRDELDDLVVSAAQLAAELEQLRQTVEQTERLRLLGQLAGGLAHQLRNAVTGARLAVQLHQKRCSIPNSDNDESLAVALRQLALTEDEIQRLLSLNRHEPSNSVDGRLADVVTEIEQLIRPHANHGRVELTISSESVNDATITDVERFRAAIMNLLLNAIEAVGPDGRVWLDVRSTEDVHRVTVSDDGSGPPPEIADTLFNPFVTSKPEGVGLGLALARQVAQDSGGELTWSRKQERTVFEFLIPVSGSDR